ncbi:hypothetical protein CXF82_04730 [Shewanella sp. GutDb-MelDb]|nr:hypothetical protein CXF82_04730 [Shewanella sp. GutDb-MelDb]
MTMKNMKLFALATTLAVSLVAPMAANATGFYLGANAGSGQQSNQLMDKATTTNVGSIKAGYDFNDYFGAEVRYGGVNSSSSDIELNSFTSVYAKAQLPVSESFTVYGLAGATSANLPGMILDDKNSSESSASFGAGVRYSITDSLGVSLEATRISSHDAYKLDAVMLGVDYKF